jgi:hypothetical protein
MIDTRVWQEDAGDLVRDSLRLEARRRHLRHQPPLSVKAWTEMRQWLLPRIREKAGSFPPSSCPIEIAAHGEIEMPGFRIRKLSYQSRPGFRVTANLYVPAGTGRFPAVLNVHGHWAEGKAGETVQARAQTLALDGFVCLTVDAMGAGERGTVPGEFEYHGARIGGTLLNIGETLLGMQVYDNMRALDVLESLDMVDAARLGVTGASGGGGQTLWVTALDERVKAAVPVVSVGTFEAFVGRRNCICEVLPDGLTLLEEWAVLALAAPRPLLMINSLTDSPSFCVQEMLRSYAAARDVYRLLDADDKLAYQAVNVPHGYGLEMREAMLGWFRKWLKGQGDGRSCRTPEGTVLDAEACACFPGGRRPRDVASVLDYVRPVARRLAAQSERDIAAAGIQAQAEALGRLLRVPKSDGYTIGGGRRHFKGGRDIRKLTMETEAGIPVPLVIVSAQDSRPDAVRIEIHPDGKAAAMKGALQHLGRGEALVLADPRGTGESCWDKEPLQGVRFHDAARAALWLGRTMIGDWVADILGIARFLREDQGVKCFSLVAHQEMGVAALAAAVLSGDFQKVRVCGMLGSYVPDRDYIGMSMAYHVPGLLKWGDVATLAALAGEAAVEIVDPVHGDGTPYDAEALGALQAAIDRLTAALNLPKHVTVSAG